MVFASSCESPLKRACPPIVVRDASRREAPHHEAENKILIPEEGRSPVSKDGPHKKPRRMTGAGLIIAAPSSASGKTIFTLGLLRALSDRGVDVAAAKVGPDYIDPAFLMAASRGPCPNLDSWAMRPATLAARVEGLSAHPLTICEGVMGLFDGAPALPGEPSGSTAEIAALTGWPVILLVDAARQSGSPRPPCAALPATGPMCGSPVPSSIALAGPGHRLLIEEGLRRSAFPICPLLGWLPRDPTLILPERHLGLVQAREDARHRNDGIVRMAQMVAEHVDIDALIRLAQPARATASKPAHRSRRRDNALPWRATMPSPSPIPKLCRLGATRARRISFFSPLTDEAPGADADAIYLPGGYPELQAGLLAKNHPLPRWLRAAAETGAAILGECGGGDVLGEALEDGDGATHAMAGLLPPGDQLQDPAPPPWVSPLHPGHRHAAGSGGAPGSGPMNFTMRPNPRRRFPPLYRGRRQGPCPGSDGPGPGPNHGVVHAFDRRRLTGWALGINHRLFKPLIVTFPPW